MDITLTEPAIYPEIESAAATPEAVHALYNNEGAFLVRSFLSQDEVGTLRNIASICYAMGEAIATNSPPDQLPRDIAVGLAVRGYITWNRTKALLVSSGTKFNTQLDFIAAKINTISKAVYANPTVKLLDVFSLIRRQRKLPPAGEETAVPWHRDFSFVGAAGIDRSVNFWIPLAEVGKAAPSIEVIVGSHNHMVNVPDDTPGITNIPEEWVSQHLGGYRRWTPHCKPGDILVFDHQTVHRTQLLATQASTDRVNFEMRWAPSDKESPRD